MSVNKQIASVFRPFLRDFVLRYQAFKFRGDSVYCPICDAHYKTFLPGGYVRNRRPKSRCPGCRSLERHRLMWLYLRNNTRLFTDKVYLLHIAPEHFFIGRLKKQSNLSYLTADLERAAMVQMDITKINYPDNTFGAILCSHVLEHVPDDQLAMQELHRVLQPGGWAILQVPIDESLETTFGDGCDLTENERIEQFGHHDHKRQYGRDYKERLASAGFDVTVDWFVQTLDAESAEKMNLNLNEAIYFCQKKKVEPVVASSHSRVDAQVMEPS